MQVQLGDVVLYQLSELDVEGINRRREHAIHNLDLMRILKTGYQAHVGNRVYAGEPVPMIVTKIWSSDCVNGQATLDGTDSLWVISIAKGKGPGTWSPRR